MKLLAEQAGDYQAVIPIIEKRIYGMTALYRTDSHTLMEPLITSGSLKVSGLVDVLATKRITKQTLQSADPDLDTLRNINEPADYLQYLDSLQLKCPESVRAKLR